MFLGIIFVIIFHSILILVHEVGHFLTAKKFGLLGEDGADSGSREKERSFVNLSIEKRAIIIAAGVLMNFLLGWIVLSIIFMIGIPQVVLITEIKQNSPAAEISLKTGDQIIEINSVKIATDNKNIFGSEQVIKIINENRGKETAIKIKRNGEIIDFSVIPRINPPAGEGSLV